MTGPRLPLVSVFAVALVVATLLGCHFRPEVRLDDDSPYYNGIASRVEVPVSDLDVGAGVVGSQRPFSLANQDNLTFRNLTLDEAIRQAVANSDVIRDLGGRVVNAPAGVETTLEHAIEVTDPRFGPEAALAQFDAQFQSSLTFIGQDRNFNNPFFGGGTTAFEQEQIQFRAEVSKQAATGSQFTIRNITEYEKNNSPNNLFTSAWDQTIEFEFRHPLLQSGGILFNRIAGPGGRPGFYNGVIVTRINTDIVLADLERAVRDLVADVERTYWELYLAYRNLDAQVVGRDQNLTTWRIVNAKVGADFAAREREALARNEYYSAQAQVEDALNGAPNRNSPNQLLGSGTGVFSAERRLRVLMGMTNADGELLIPTDEPTTAAVAFDWDESLANALVRRVELRRQRWAIKRRELELLASRNFLNGRLDLVTSYNLRGFGDHLFGPNNPPNNSAFGSFGSLDGYNIGVQYQTAVGNRIGHLGVRNAELLLARERAIYREQEQQISYEVAAAVAELERAFTVAKSAYNSRVAAIEHLRIQRTKFELFGEEPRKGVTLEFLLDSVERAVQADAAYFRALVDYNLAISNVRYAQGRYLPHHNVMLGEGPWSYEAHASAAQESRKLHARELPYHVIPAPVSGGVFPQQPPNPEPIRPGDAPGEMLIPPQPHEQLPPPTEPNPAPRPLEVRKDDPFVISG